MATTKASLISTINGFLTAIITQLKVRNSLLELVNELYPIVVNDSNTTETYTTKSGTDISYSITINKSGNSGHIKVSVTNNRTYALGYQNIFIWKTNQYRPKSGINDFRFKAINGVNEIELFLSNNVLFLYSAIPALSTYESEYKFYITQD